jgi:hypothetical protein
MADAPYVDTGMSVYKSQHASKRKICWIQKIFLGESVPMYEILQVLDTAGSHPNGLLVCRLDDIDGASNIVLPYPGS